jgi:hypothetical protein
MQRMLILLGVLVLSIGLAWPWVSRLPLGRLPGDFSIDRPGFKLYFPLVTCLLLSALISLIAWLFRR